MFEVSQILEFLRYFKICTHAIELSIKKGNVILEPGAVDTPDDRCTYLAVKKMPR